MKKKKYIDVDKISWHKIQVEQRCCNDRWDETYTVAYKNEVDDISAADVVPVIRCKNCQNFNNKSCATGYGTCLILGRMMKNDEYCCYGKERNNV